MRKLPPLNSIRAFEATARNLSFTKAANELNVSAGAISQQVKLLEDYLAIQLFKRKNRKIMLTDEAQVGLPQIIKGLDHLLEGINAIQNYQIDKPLTITLPPTFATRWLIPRLNSFQKLHPEIDVRIDATYKVLDLINDDIDAGIRFCSGNHPEFQADFLFSQKIMVVCSPALLEKGVKLEVPEDLENFTLLHCDFHLWTSTKAQPDWDMWFSLAGIDNFDTSRGVYFSQHDLLVQAAIEGQGVALVASVSADKAIKEGLLISPFKCNIPLDDSYYFICSKMKSNLPRVKVFRNWLLTEVEKAIDLKTGDDV